MKFNVNETDAICGATKQMASLWTCTREVGHTDLPHFDETENAWWLPGAYGTCEPHHITVEVKGRPKIDWNGFGYRWACSCGDVGSSWETNTDQAYKSGGQHAIQKMENEQDFTGE